MLVKKPHTVTYVILLAVINKTAKTFSPVIINCLLVLTSLRSGCKAFCVHARLL